MYFSLGRIPIKIFQKTSACAELFLPSVYHISFY